MRTRGVRLAVAALVLGVGLAGVVAAAPVQAVPLVPAAPATAGTATVTDQGWQSEITLTGSIVVGSGEFVGTAVGRTDSSFGGSGASTSLMNPFVLEGPDLTGTCAGHWTLAPGSGTASVIAALGSPVSAGAPVRVGSLSCTLQLGQAAPAQTGLSLLVVDDPRTWDASGVYGPGLLSVGLPAPQTLGTADRTEFSTGNELDTHYDLIGDIAIGGTVFTGRASGQHSHWGGDPAPPFTLSGASPAGDLSAVCTEGEPVTAPWPADVALRELACTGQVGSGPPGTVTLLLALPVSTPRYGNPCGRCSTNDGTGVFIAG